MLYNNVIIESTSREAIDGNETRNRVIICEHRLDDIELAIPLGYSMKSIILLKDYTLFIFRFSSW